MSELRPAQSAQDINDEVRGWMEEHGDYLFRYALRHFRDTETAEDLLQETFLAATRGQSQFRGQAAARTWLTSILRHKIIDRIRKKNSDRHVSFEDLGEEAIANLFNSDEHWVEEAGPREWGMNPEEACERSEFRGVMQACLEKLPEKFRHIFVMREVDGLSREEISADFGLTTTNIGVILHRARILLRGCLQRNWLEVPAHAGAK